MDDETDEAENDEHEHDSRDLPHVREIERGAREQQLQHHCTSGSSFGKKTAGAAGRWAAAAGRACALETKEGGTYGDQAQRASGAPHMRTRGEAGQERYQRRQTAVKWN